MKTTIVKRTLAVAFCASILSGVNAQKWLLPQPQEITVGKGSLKSAGFRIDDAACPEAGAMAAHSGLQLSASGTPVRLIMADTLPFAPEGKTDEAYSLTVGKKEISITATTPVGFLRGMQTLSQLAAENGGKIAQLTINDWAAFPIRGFMQDVGRTYISMDELKREIDLLARFKVNVFHWHLTENQAWRLESKLYPQLTADSVITRMKGCVYTHDDARELQRYCRERGVLLIPELDMPGHSAAFVRAFGVDMQSEEGTRIVKDLVAEACEVFADVPYLHIGTDEVEFTNPRFCTEMVEFVRSKGKKAISWNPGWNYKAGEIDMTQMWSYRGRPTPGVPAIDCKLHYINHYDNFADIVALYTSRIGNVAEADGQIAGSIIALWNDRYLASEPNIPLENHLYPNTLAIAERGWKGGGWQYFDDFGTNLLPGTEAFDAFANFEQRLDWHKHHTLTGAPVAYMPQTDVVWRISDAYDNGGKLDAVFAPEAIKDNPAAAATIPSREAVGAGIYLRHVWGPGTVKGFFAEPKPNQTAYAWTYVYTPREQEVGLWFETQNYSRSEMDLPPRPGTWDYRQSHIWLNGVEVEPPVWTATHSVKSNETPLGNENMVSRAPIPVTLRKGWNQVLIKLPYGQYSSHETRICKWMFSALFVTQDGSDRVEGLIYSPDQKK